MFQYSPSQATEATLLWPKPIDIKECVPTHRELTLVSAPGMHCDAASGLMFYRRFFFFFQLSPHLVDNGCTVLSANYCVNTADEKIPRLKIW